MPTYITLAKWTEQGVRDVKQTVERAEQVRAMVKQAGGDMHTIYWTQGRYDIVAITEAPDDETVAAISLRIGAAGNIRTEVLRAFDAEGMAAILAKLS